MVERKRPVSFPLKIELWQLAFPPVEREFCDLSPKCQANSPPDAENREIPGNTDPWVFRSVRATGLEIGLAKPSYCGNRVCNRQARRAVERSVLQNSSQESKSWIPINLAILGTTLPAMDSKRAAGRQRIGVASLKLCVKKRMRMRDEPSAGLHQTVILRSVPL